tara:strand:- start:497 stop:913 length:417 start_codon:yes stop_codon:yes gene_type:complete
VDCWTLVVNDFCRQAAESGKIAIRGPSNVVRNFITISDVCRAIELLSSSSLSLETSLICNLGDKTKTLFGIASAIREIYLEERCLPIDIIKIRDDFPDVQHLDFQSSALSRMNFQPCSNFKEELRSLIEFCENEFGGY